MGKPNRDVQVRWMIRRDMPTVIEIERASFANPWGDDDFLGCLRERNCIGMVAESGSLNVVAFMVYELSKNRLQILNFAVSPDWRRKGIGAALVLRMRDKLSPQRRHEIIVDCRESLWEMHAFLRNQEFLCHGITRGFYGDPEEDAYHFSLDISGREKRFEVKHAEAAKYSDGYPKSYVFDDEDE